MAKEALEPVRRRVSEAINDMRGRAERLSPLDIHARMEAIRDVAAAHGLAPLEGLARCSAQLALLPGHRISTRTCLEHFDIALECDSQADCTTILAALAARLH